MTSARRGADVLLVGLGAAGGIAAHVLTRAGLEVVALEAGPRVEASMMTLDEIRNDVREWLAQPKAAHEVPAWQTDGATGMKPLVRPMVNAVGGSTVHYPGLSIRLQPWNFESRTRTIAHYGAGAVPAGSTLADWPLRYGELEPFYDLVERAIGVSGDAGNVGGALAPAGNPFEGARASDYPMAALRRTGWTELTASAGRRLGWHPFPAPSAINSRPYDGRPECTYCGFCVYNGCYREAKGSTDVNVIPAAEKTGLLKIVTSANVRRIEVDVDGLVTGATYVKDGREHFQPAKVVLLGTFTYENTRLLLLSRSKAFPNGLSNRGDQVGKNFMAHINVFVFGNFPGRRLNAYSGTWSQATCLDDWNGDNFDHTGLGFIAGGMLTAPHELKPIATAAYAVPPTVPRWGTAWKAWLQRHAQSVGYVNGQLENLSYETNRLELDSAVPDRDGVPRVHVTHRIGENERRGYEFLRAKLEAWLLEAGAGETWSPVGLLAEPQHAYGGTRMGENPETSVVDRYGFSHEAPNLGVLGASVFPTTGGHNPTLTVQALAWRTAGHLVESWRSKARGA